MWAFSLGRTMDILEGQGERQRPVVAESKKLIYYKWLNSVIDVIVERIQQYNYPNIILIVLKSAKKMMVRKLDSHNSD